jgi:hypothetical protein
VDGTRNPLPSSCYILDDRGTGVSFLFSAASRLALVLTQPPIQWVPGAWIWPQTSIVPKLRMRGAVTPLLRMFNEAHGSLYVTPSCFNCWWFWILNGEKWENEKFVGYFTRAKAHLKGPHAPCGASKVKELNGCLYRGGCYRKSTSGPPDWPVTWTLGSARWWSLTWRLLALITHHRPSEQEAAELRVCFTVRPSVAQTT